MEKNQLALVILQVLLFHESAGISVRFMFCAWSLVWLLIKNIKAALDSTYLYSRQMVISIKL